MPYHCQQTIAKLKQQYYHFLMSDLLPRVQLTIVERLMWQYYNELLYHQEMFNAEDINLDEFKELALAIDERYAIKIFKAVLS